MVDSDGFRPNVGIVLCNAENDVFWGKRVRQHSWQFPQGGIQHGETPEQAMYRELHEEVGLHPEHVRILGRTRGWLRYEVPQAWVRRDWRGVYRGQKQIWFLLRMTGSDSAVSLRASSHPEFDAWRWTHYWLPVDQVIDFKRDVYQRALSELLRYLSRDRQGRPVRLPRPPRQDAPGEIATDAPEAEHAQRNPAPAALDPAPVMSSSAAAESERALMQAPERALAACAGKANKFDSRD